MKKLLYLMFFVFLFACKEENTKISNESIQPENNYKINIDEKQIIKDENGNITEEGSLLNKKKNTAFGNSTKTTI